MICEKLNLRSDIHFRKFEEVPTKLDLYIGEEPHNNTNTGGCIIQETGTKAAENPGTNITGSGVCGDCKLYVYCSAIAEIEQ